MASEAQGRRLGFIDWTPKTCLEYARGKFSISIEQRYWLWVETALMWQWLTDRPREVRRTEKQKASERALFRARQAAGTASYAYTIIKERPMADTQVPAGAAEVKIMHGTGKKKPKKKRY